MNSSEKTLMLERIAHAAVPDSMDLWPEVRQLAGHRVRPVSPRKRWSRLAVAGLASAAAVVALLLGAGAQLWSGAETVSAATLLDRAEAAAVNVNTYHLRMTRQVPGKSGDTIASEIWYGGTDRQRLVQETRDASGALTESQVVVSNGAETWMAVTRSGHTTAIHTTGTEWTPPADAPSASGNLTSVLARYSSDKACMTAQLAGEGTLAGRAVYQIDVTPKPGACGVAVGDYRVGQVRQGEPDSDSRRVARMSVSVDKQTFLPLKTEVRDASGAVLDRAEVSFLEYGVTIADSSFSYSPPAGAQVSTFTGGSGADVKRTLAEHESTPRKSP